MSQSDYIQRKRIASQVATKSRVPIHRGDNPAILSSQLLTELKQYDLENTIINSLTRFNQLVPASDIIVMDMQLRQPCDTYKTYRTCINGSNTLPNRVPVQTFYDAGKKKPYVTPRKIYPYKCTYSQSTYDIVCP